MGKCKKRWSKEEVALLKEYYPKGGTRLCKDRGLKRTNSSIIAKSRLLGITYKNKTLSYESWSSTDLNKLKKYYPLGGVLLCKEKGLNYSKHTIHNKASKLGLKVGKGKAKRSTMWCNSEIDILIKYYPKGGYSLCKEKGLTKSKYSIYLKANSLGLFKNVWDDNSLSILREYYPKGGYKLCIKKGLSISKNLIIKQANLDGLTYKAGVNWSEKEDKILREYYPKGGYKLCLEKGLDVTRTKSAVYTRVCKSKIKSLNKEGGSN